MRPRPHNYLASTLELSGWEIGFVIADSSQGWLNISETILASTFIILSSDRFQICAQQDDFSSPEILGSALVVKREEGAGGVKRRFGLSSGWAPWETSGCQGRMWDRYRVWRQARSYKEWRLGNTRESSTLANLLGTRHENIRGKQKEFNINCIIIFASNCKWLTEGKMLIHFQIHFQINGENCCAPLLEVKTPRLQISAWGVSWARKGGSVNLL